MKQCRNGIALIVGGCYFWYETSAFAAMLHDQSKLTFLRYPLTMLLASIGNLGSGFEYVFFIGFFSLWPLGLCLILAGCRLFMMSVRASSDAGNNGHV